MAIRISKDIKIILFIVLGILVLGGGGYLLWRVNQEETVAPEDSEATCPSGCYFIEPVEEEFFCINGSYTESFTAGCFKSQYIEVNGSLTPCWFDCVTPPIDPTTCESIPNLGDTGPVGSSCDSTNCGGPCNEFTYKCGTLCYDASCGADACGYTPPVTQFTLQYTAGSNGTLTGSTSQTVNQGSSGTAVTAVPDSGYEFSEWSDDSTTNPRTDTNVQGNITVSAIFVSSTIATYDCTNFAATCSADKSSIVITWTAINDPLVDRYVVRVNEYPFSDWFLVGSDIFKNVDKTETTYTISDVEDGIEYNVHVVAYKEGDEIYPTCLIPGSVMGTGVVSVTCSTEIIPGGDEPVVGESIPQTGIFDTVLGTVSVGTGFILLGGLVSQYSKLNYMFNSISERSKFKKDIRKERRINRRRNKLEKRFKS